jgi:hypothetical protein
MAPDPNKSFFTAAAWYGLIAPFTTAGIAWLILAAQGRSPRGAPDPADTVLGLGLIALVSSLAMSLVSLLGIRKHGARVILWKALFGILASCFFGYLFMLVGVAGVCRQ